MNKKINETVVTANDIETLQYQLTLDAYALLKYFGYKGKIKYFRDSQITKESDSLAVVKDFIEKSKQLCAIDKISDEQIVRTQNLTFAILNSILSNIKAVSNCDLYGKYIEHIDKLTKFVVSSELETKACPISDDVKTAYLVELLTNAERACVNGFNEEYYKLGSKIIDKTLREAFLGKYGKPIRRQLLKSENKQKIKQVLSYQRTNKKIYNEYNPSGLKRIIIEHFNY